MGVEGSGTKWTFGRCNDTYTKPTLFSYCILLYLFFVVVVNYNYIDVHRSNYLLVLCREDSPLEFIMTEYKRLVPRVSRALLSIDKAPFYLKSIVFVLGTHTL